MVLAGKEVGTAPPDDPSPGAEAPTASPTQGGSRARAGPALPTPHCSASSSGAVIGVVRDFVAARTAATSAGVTAGAELPKLLRT